MTGAVISALVTGLVVGVLVGLAVRARSAGRARQEAAAARIEATRYGTELEVVRRSLLERSADEEAARARMGSEFSELSAQALQRASEQFLQLADVKLQESRQVAENELALRHQAIDALLVPLKEQLGAYGTGVQRLEVERQKAYSELVEQMKTLSTSHDRLERETRNLVTALRSPQTRGRWGELQLRRVVEMAGMLAHCDFDEQVTADTDAGRLRPDMVVHLPGGKNVAVDAKAPMQAFLAANEADDEDVRRDALRQHARQVKAHVDALARKEYWKGIEPSPEFVVAFIPGDSLLTAALEHEPGLMEHAVANHVLLATPTSLIALLRAVSYGWQQDALAEHAREVQKLGAELYRRLGVFSEHLGKIGKGLSQAVGSYNQAVGSLESRVLVTARQFSSMGVMPAGEKVLPTPDPVDLLARELSTGNLPAVGWPEETQHDADPGDEGGPAPEPEGA